MNDIRLIDESRRQFLKLGAGLTLALYLPEAAAKVAASSAAKTVKAPVLEPNAFVRIGTDGIVTVIVKHLEMGQGTYTGLPTIVAEELDAAWSQVRVEGAPVDVERYANTFWGKYQGTGGSNAVANSWEQLRRAGATARAMLVAAAAQKWNVPAESIKVRDGIVSTKGHKAGFGELAAAAAELPVPEEVKLKDPKEFTLIGKQRLPRKDGRVKIEGRALYTQDVRLPGMLTAVVAHPPRFGATLKSWDDKAALKVKGVTDVVMIPTGIAVVAENFWAAKKGRDALRIEWDESTAFKLGSAEILAQFKELAAKPGAVARNDGDAEKALAGAAKVLEAEFEFPYLAHAAMEPLDCVIQMTLDSAEVWNGEQFQTADQTAVSWRLAIHKKDVKINMLYAGGSFGRRANPHSDYILEATNVAIAINGKAPVKLIWTREDDMRAGYYRPTFYHTLCGGLDAQGNPVAWKHRLVGQSIVTGTTFEAGMVKDGVDKTSVEGAANLPYAIPNLAVDLHSPKLGVPVQWWRSVGSSHTAFSTEVFLDELAHAAGQDAVAFRRKLLKDQPRHLAVLELAAAKAGWDKPLAPGKPGDKRGRGVAVHESFHTWVAEVAEVTVKADGSFSVDRVVCAVDCGIAVNPDVIRAQMEGGIGFGLSAALHGAITLRDGQVEQSNFHDYPLLRIHEMPKVEVHIVPSAEKPSGVGEPGVPPIAPAVANALFAAVGKRLRKLPLRLNG